MPSQFLSTLSLRRATRENADDMYQYAFLSTLSLRRATPHYYQQTAYFFYFYPRSPCGERPSKNICIYHTTKFLSTLSLRRATTWARGSRVTYVISIHALLAESDLENPARAFLISYFYPRSPCGERPFMTLRHCTTYLFLSTLSLRRATGKPRALKSRRCVFLSTLSLRRATKPNKLAGLKLVFLSTLSLRRAT